MVGFLFISSFFIYKPEPIESNSGHNHKNPSQAFTDKRDKSKYPNDRTCIPKTKP